MTHIIEWRTSFNSSCPSPSNAQEVSEFCLSTGSPAEAYEGLRGNESPLVILQRSCASLYLDMHNIAIYDICALLRMTNRRRSVIKGLLQSFAKKVLSQQLRSGLT